jgi:hypothetical protein
LSAPRPYVKLHIRPIMHSPRLCEVSGVAFCKSLAARGVSAADVVVGWT